MVDKEKVCEIVSEYKDEKGALIPILQKTQQTFGYLPKEALEIISSETKTPLSRIYGVVTFYAQFYLKPRGRYVIKSCQGTACHVRGGKKVLEEIERKLGIKAGETTEDLKFSLETVACLGTCFLAPVMMINDKYFGKLTPQSAVKAIEEIEKNGI